MSDSCTACKKSPPEVNLKRCAKCNTTPYCSRDCQKADWKTHKKICGQNQADNAAAAPPSAKEIFDLGGPSPPQGLDGPITKPFTRLEKGTWLHGRSERDVYRLLIDAYRLRVEDLYNLDNDIDEGSIYAGRSSGIRGFKRFLRRTAKRRAMLPPWWNEEKQKECEALGMEPDQWWDLRRAVEKQSIIDHYGDFQFPMQLRMFAADVYGRAPGGRTGRR
ncbi:hypothetical protein PT974_01066 [Cladobotryum mycophilum]|uniref:MYND-type domain-containing protein n=1 Tax=Cladobotryum mycophilum TaxID=491253 RepID=A0ABR0T2N9_9HYPO